jgi:hypothetical protein
VRQINVATVTNEQRNTSSHRISSLSQTAVLQNRLQRKASVKQEDQQSSPMSKSGEKDRATPSSFDKMKRDIQLVHECCKG